MDITTSEDEMGAFCDETQQFEEDTWQSRVEFAVTCGLILLLGALMFGN